jgi:hypothetical protein
VWSHCQLHVLLAWTRRHESCCRTDDTHRRVGLNDVLQLLGRGGHKVHCPQHILLPGLDEVVCFLAAAETHDLQAVCQTQQTGAA